MTEREDVVSFLTATVTGDKGFFCLLFAPDDLHEEFFEWPSQLDQIVDRVLDPASTNVYFSPHLFSQRSSEKQYVLPTRTIVADLDYANLQDLQVAPTTLVESSPNRHQGYWVLREQLPLQELEQLSKKLSYSIPSCDTSGWWLGHKFRIPGTRNFKYNPPATVKYASAYSTERPTSLSELTMWVGETPVDNVKSVAQGEEWLNSLPTQLDKGPRETLEKFRTQIGAKPTMYYNQQQPDRSEALWALMSALFRAGASRDEVFWIAKHSANNKFADSKYHNDRDLAKDVLRCERAMSEERTDIRMTIAVAMKMPGNAVDRKRLITRLVVSELEKRGEFIKTTDDRLWYMNHQTGRPVYLSKHSPSLEAILDQVFDLNPQDGYQPYVIGHIVSLAHTKGRTVPIGILSDASADRLLLHDGRGGVYNITPSGFKREINGTHNILFPWRAAGEEPIIIGEPLNEDWTDWLFNDSWFDNLVELSPVQARMLVKVWFHFILFREWAMTRPILALFGQAGSGKTTLFHLVYNILYGRFKSLNTVTTPFDFDSLTANDPLAVFDGVDTPEHWLADRLSQAAAKSEIVKRKLYTDADVVTLRRQAILGVTAHDPQFTRNDVVDRLIILNFKRREQGNFIPATIFIDRVWENRERIWGSIVKEAQLVLAQPWPSVEEIPNFRISDFARVGMRIAQALGKGDLFYETIVALKRSQVAVQLSNDDTLINAIALWHRGRNGNTPEYVTAGYLHDTLAMLDDSFRNSYRTSSYLGRKLWVLQSTLREVFDITAKFDDKLGVRLWKIDPKGQPSGRVQG